MLLPADDPDPAESLVAPPLSGGLRAVPDGSQRAVQCCWRPGGAGGTESSSPAGQISGQLCELSWCLPSNGFRSTLTWTRERIFLVVLIFIWVTSGLCAFTCGGMVEGPTGDGLNVVQSMYLMSQIVSTTGYGDMTPRTEAGMAFVSCYILFSGLMFSGIIMELIDGIVDKHQAQADRVMHKLLGEAVDEETKFAKLFEKYSNLVMAATFYTLCLLVWTLFFVSYCDKVADVCEELTVIESFYFAVVSCCGVGFGDITPRTTMGELFVTFASVVGIVTYVNLVGAISDTWLKEKQFRRLEALTQEHFSKADTSADGKIDLYEFTRFFLTHYELISEDVLENIKQNFHDLDLNGSGDITAEDLALMMNTSRVSLGGGKLPVHVDDARLPKPEGGG